MDVRVWMCVDACMDLCMDVCMDVCMDACMDVRVDVCVSGQHHAPTHLCRLRVRVRARTWAIAVEGVLDRDLPLQRVECAVLPLHDAGDLHAKA